MIRVMQEKNIAALAVNEGQISKAPGLVLQMRWNCRYLNFRSAFI